MGRDYRSHFTGEKTEAWGTLGICCCGLCRVSPGFQVLTDPGSFQQVLKGLTAERCFSRTVMQGLCSSMAGQVMEEATELTEVFGPSLNSSHPLPARL